MSKKRRESPPEEAALSTLPTLRKAADWGEGELAGYSPPEDFALPACPSFDWENWKNGIDEKWGGYFELHIGRLEQALDLLKQKSQAALPEDIHEASRYLQDFQENLAIIYDQFPAATKVVASYLSDVGMFLDKLKLEINRTGHFV